MTKVEEAEKAARWVVEKNGCIALPHNPPVELRHAAMRALYYVVFADRPPNAPGGILRGYQLPGRMLEHFPGAIRNYGTPGLVANMKRKSEESSARKRKLVVDTLFERACRIILSRNNGSTIHPPTTTRRPSDATQPKAYLPTTISPDTIGAILESIGAKAILEQAA